ncbi:hypothetical protein AB6A40_003927 [Gnathostoma spinigerum]|uniref:Integrase catalytic domain-containing protein n=1 Tax=Gnathostoma spinigerum TaxID=75299 RepID=A0ABD6EJR8_9BILA
MHGGVASTLVHLRSHHWIPHGRRTVRSVIQDRCLQCRRWSSRPFASPNAPPLPAERVQRSPPFAHTAVDYSGPINVKATMGTVKRWFALFTCFATRVIHLEVANDLSTSAFTDCFRRFIARRGVPKVMLSDNGTNFKLTASALKEVRDYLGNQLVEWRFVTALTPPKSGLYESLLGIVKTSMRKTVGNRFLTEIQLATLVTEVEAVVNQRPLTYVESDFLEVLRRTDFLATKATLMLNVDHSTDSDEWMLEAPSTRIALLRQWSRTQQHLEQFWKAWQPSYLAMLRERARFTHAGPYRQTERAPHVEEVVLVRETNVPRGMWKPGQVTKTPMGTGDVIRSAEVRIASGRTILRPISLLYSLEVSSDADRRALPDHEEDSARSTKKVEKSTQERRATRSMTRGNPQVGEVYVPPVLPPL